MRTHDERAGDHWIIIGQKLWITTGEKASHVWLAVRTAPQATPKAKGISVFLVPFYTPDITIQLGMAMYGLDCVCCAICEIEAHISFTGTTLRFGRLCPKALRWPSR